MHEVQEESPEKALAYYVKDTPLGNANLVEKGSSFGSERICIQDRT